jgi:starch phosphorylase
VFAANDLPGVGGHGVFLEEYDLRLASLLVQGCDLWLNLPRPPLEASGTSGMKSALNGGLQMSVLDGWWAEAFDGSNGWGLSSDSSLPPEQQDSVDADAFYSLLENEAVPLFYDRDDAGLPRGWLRMMRRSLATVLSRYTAHRMLLEYQRASEAAIR